MNYNDYLLNGRVNIIDKSQKTAKICNDTPMLYNENVRL